MSGGELRILHVEDTENDALLVTLELHRSGYELVYERVASESAMRAALAEKKWDAILADYVVPGFGGLEALAVLKESGLDLPFLIVSGEVGEEAAVAAMKAGAHDYIMKGNLTRLVVAIERELREAATRMERRQAEAELAERSRLATLGAEIAVNLASDQPLAAILRRCAEAMVRHIDAAFARVWTLDETGSVLELRASAGLYTHLDGVHSRIPVGALKIGQIAAERRPHLTNAVIGDPRIGDQEWARREGMVAFAGYPLLVDQRLEGVVAVFARRPLGDFTLQALAAAANEIAVGIRRKRVEQEVRQREARFRSLIEHASDLIAVIGNDGTVRYASPSHERVLGYRGEDLVGTDALALVHPDDRGRVAEFFRRGVAKMGETGAVEFRSRHVNGDWRTIEAAAQNVYDDPIVSGIVVNSRDVTERRRAQEEAAALAEVARELISTLDRASLAVRLCRVAAKVLGCEVTSVLLREDDDCYVPIASHGATADADEAAAAIRLSAPALSELLASLGTRSVVEVAGGHAAPAARALPEIHGLSSSIYAGLWRGGDLVGLLLAGSRGKVRFGEPQARIARGIAQLASLALDNTRLFTNLERAIRLKSDFAATMSHELRTPLNIVLGYTDLLADGCFGPLTTEQSETLARMRRSGEHLLGLITATLDLGRLEAGQLRVDVADVDLPRLLESLREEVLPAKDRTGPIFQWNIAPGLPKVRTDPAKLRVILRNLLDNAVRFTDEGAITVGAARVDAGVVISVVDTGIGITPDTLPDIFESFRQGEPAARLHRAGLGLGLYIARRLADLAGATIEVESEPNRGSSFRVRLPRDGGVSDERDGR